MCSVQFHLLIFSHCHLNHYFWACTQTLFYFSFRSFFSFSSASIDPLAMAVNKSQAVFIFYHGRSTDFEEKIEGLWTNRRLFCLSFSAAIQFEVSISGTGTENYLASVHRSWWSSKFHIHLAGPVELKSWIDVSCYPSYSSSCPAHVTFTMVSNQWSSVVWGLEVYRRWAPPRLCLKSIITASAVTLPWPVSVVS